MKVSRPLNRPDRSDPKGFACAVADAYLSAAQEDARRPAQILAAESGVPVSTMRRWIAEARRQGALPAKASSRRAAAGKANVLRRHYGPDAPETLDAVRELKTTQLAEHIRRLVDEAPPLTETQRANLAALLRPVDRAEARGA